jgi:hypothetical protein
MARAKASGLETTAGVLEMKLGFCLTAPTKRAIADLHEVARLCNVARNGILRHWERWREDHPDWVPQQRRDRKGEAKVARKMTVEKPWRIKQVKDLLAKSQATENEKGEVFYNGKMIGKFDDAPVLEDPACSQDLENELYYRGCQLAPSVGCSIMAQLRSEVLDRLKTKMPYNHPGVAKVRWEGILKYECARDCYRSISIPAPNSITVVGYEGLISRDISSGVSARLLKLCQSNAIVRLQLFSRESGRTNLDHVFWIEARQLPRGKKAILRKVVSGEWKHSDSKVVYKRDGWYYQLTYKQPQKSLNLTKDNVATIVMNPANATNPLSIRFKRKDGRVITWQLGDANVLLAEYKRLEVRRLALQTRYRTASSGRKGHGRQRAYRSQKPITRKLNDLQEVFTNYIVASVIKFCTRHDCGTVIYREPSLFLRDFSWFAKKGHITYNWTSLANKLKHKTWINGIDLDVCRMGYKEHKEMFPDAYESKNAKGVKEAVSEVGEEVMEKVLTETKPQPNGSNRIKDKIVLKK